MILLIDAGNTRLHWAYADRHALLNTGHRQHHGKLPSAVTTAWRDGDRPDRVMMASVTAGKLAQAIHEWVSQSWNMLPEEMTTASHAAGVHNGYREPGQLGVDRWLALIAAYHRYQRSVCVFDCGTALTADVVAGDGRHLGGLIMPGLTMMRQSLSSGTEAIPEISASGDQADNWLAGNTRDAVSSGTQYMQLAVIRQFVSDARKALGEEPVCVVTGGAARPVQAMLGDRCHYDPDLVFHGMLVMAGTDI